MLAAAVPTLVLDTNVVLALWLFRDERLSALAGALERGQAQWLLTRPMLDELMHEFDEPRCSRYGVAREDALTQVLALGRQVEPPSAAGTSLRLRCTDPDDQIFIDLALQLGAATLLSRDRAVLKLARRARPLGLTILAPERWAP